MEEENRDQLHNDESTIPRGSIEEGEEEEEDTTMNIIEEREEIQQNRSDAKFIIRRNPKRGLKTIALMLSVLSSESDSGSSE